MQRYFVTKEQIVDHVVTIIGDDVKHISRVMRMSVGNEIICSDGVALTARCVIDELTEERVVANIIEELEPNTELPIRVSIAQALPKGDKLELIIQKGTELGASEFLPFSAVRSIVKWDQKKSEKKIERLNKIAKEAAEQSYRERIPLVSKSLTLKELKGKIPLFDAVIVAFEESAKEGERMSFNKTLKSLTPGQSLLIVIGPEGGLTDEEVNQLTTDGAVLCGFGPRILRTETAPLYALAAVSYHFELMRC